MNFVYGLTVLCVFLLHFEDLYSSLFALTQRVRFNILASKFYVMPVDNREILQVDNALEVYGKNIITWVPDYGVYDFIVVGAGTAGTLLANRLSEIESWKVLLLEAGGKENEFSDIPGMCGYLQFSDMNWGYYTVPQETCCFGMKDHSCNAPRGKVLGGSSTINSKMYVRGNRHDYDHWEIMGNKGWSYNHVLPYFKKTENSTIPNEDKGYHGHNGELKVQYNEPTVYTKTFMDAMEELGVEQVDYNGKNQIGASPVAFSLDGIKVETGGRTFVEPVLHRKNLKVVVNAFVTKLLMKNNKSAVRGVEFVQEGKRYWVKAEKEVILSAGTFNTPQILMLSGIGPVNQLKRLGINSILDLPVGEHLEEHAMFLGLIVKTNVSQFDESLGTYLQNYLAGQRPLTNPTNIDSQRFFNIYHENIPNIQQLLIVPPGYQEQFPTTFNFNDAVSQVIKDNYNPFTDLLLPVILLRPKSKGWVRLRSKNPEDFPKINFGMFNDPEGSDIETMYKGIMETLKLLDTDAFKAVNATLVSFKDICDYSGSKSYWYCLIRHLTSTEYHPVGTARMGPSWKTSVVNSELKVHGMGNLRVVDASVIPYIPSGNTNAPVLMIAEKISDEIKECYGVGLL